MGAMAGLPEPRRREYLAALGVPMFVARQPLPGAAPSRPLIEIMPAPASAPVADRALPAATPVAPVARERVVPAPAVDTRTLLRAEVAPPRPAPVEPVAPQASTKVTTTIPVFACRLLSVTPDLAVLLDLGEYPDLGPREATLWAALCQAFGWQPQVLAADFGWPLVPLAKASSLLGQDADAARAVLAGWLGRDLKAEHRLLVLGESLGEFVMRPHRLLPGLSRLLADPLAKRTLWLTLSADTPHA